MQERMETSITESTTNVDQKSDVDQVEEARVDPVAAVKVALDGSSLDEENADTTKTHPSPPNIAASASYREICPSKYKSHRSRAMLIINLSISLQWANCLILPAIYNALADALHFTTLELGLAHSLRLFSMFATTPLWAWITMSQHYSRRIVLSCSFVLAAFFIALNAASTSYANFMIFNILSGSFCGAVIPVSRSLVPNYFELHERGAAFGSFELFGGIGGIIGAGLGVVITRYAQPIGNSRVAYEQGLQYYNTTWEESVQDQELHAQVMAWVFEENSGQSFCCMPWQLVFLILGAIFLPAAVLIFLYVTDPVYDHKTVAEMGGADLVTRVFPGLDTTQGDNRTLTCRDVTKIAKSKTWLVIATQGIFGAMPWSGFSFLIFWFQRMYIEELLAVVIFLLVGGGAAVSGAIGGVIGDRWSRRNEFGQKYGRIMTAHISIFSGIPLSALLFALSPLHADFWWVYAIGGCILGLAIGLVPANNAAIQSDVFPQELHALSFSLQFWIEGSISAFGPFFIGAFNDYVFDAQELSSPQAEYDAFSPEKQQYLLRQFSYSVITVCSAAWSLCFLIYIPAYYYYPKESLHLQQQQIKETNDKGISQGGANEDDGFVPSDANKHYDKVEESID